ncbi:MAG: hypothetical protein ABFR75_03265 [Acidobacteriota bacterium]
MKILFLADKFDDEPRDDVSSFPGGAELTDAAIIEACSGKIEKKKFLELKDSGLNSYDLIIIGNMKTATEVQIRNIISHSNYILFEHDMRICRYDGDYLRAKKEPVHYFFKRCICPHFYLRKLYREAMGVIFLTRKQYEVYKKNPFFRADKIKFLGSSAFNRSFFERVERSKKKKKKRSGSSVFYSPHPVKGYEQSKDYCIRKGENPIEIYDKSPEEVFNILESTKNFVYLPVGIEWAGRMPVEARFLGCEVVINDNVGVAGEPWWLMDDAKALEFVKDTPDRFWRIVEELINENPC